VSGFVIFLFIFLTQGTGEFTGSPSAAFPYILAAQDSQKIFSKDSVPKDFQLSDPDHLPAPKIQSLYFHLLARQKKGLQPFIILNPGPNHGRAVEKKSPKGKGKEKIPYMDVSSDDDDADANDEERDGEEDREVAGPSGQQDREEDEDEDEEESRHGHPVAKPKKKTRFTRDDERDGRSDEGDEEEDQEEAKHGRQVGEVKKKTRFTRTDEDPEPEVERVSQSKPSKSNLKKSESQGTGKQVRFQSTIISKTDMRFNLSRRPKPRM
jgi:hypothetical protein